MDPRLFSNSLVCYHWKHLQYGTCMWPLVFFQGSTCNRKGSETQNQLSTGQWQAGCSLLSWMMPRNFSQELWFLFLSWFVQEISGCHNFPCCFYLIMISAILSSHRLVITTTFVLFINPTLRTLASSSKVPKITNEQLLWETPTRWATTHRSTQNYVISHESRQFYPCTNNVVSSMMSLKHKVDTHFVQFKFFLIILRGYQWKPRCSIGSTLQRVFAWSAVWVFTPCPLCSLSYLYTCDYTIPFPHSVLGHSFAHVNSQSQDYSPFLLFSKQPYIFRTLI